MTTVSFLNDVGADEIEIRVRLSRTELEDYELTPERIQLEFKNFFSKKKPFIDVLKGGMEDFFKTTVDTRELYVDHLCTNLEKRSIFDIVRFLSRYCGWDNIRNQMDAYITDLERGLNG